jgi:NADH-quinone oxidoreductase subunit L
MVAAGVYMLCRVFFIYQLPTIAWPERLAWLDGISALRFIAWIGGFTALLAALIACQQNDIKRILAYSTLSQLGYMVMAVGLAAPSPAMYHLTTHAFFKALLFLGAGSGHSRPAPRTKHLGDGRLARRRCAQPIARSSLGRSPSRACHC